MTTSFEMVMFLKYWVDILIENIRSFQRAKTQIMGKNPSIVGRVGDSRSRGREFESQHWILIG